VCPSIPLNDRTHGNHHVAVFRDCLQSSFAARLRRNPGVQRLPVQAGAGHAHAAQHACVTTRATMGHVVLGISTFSVAFLQPCRLTRRAGPYLTAACPARADHTTLPTIVGIEVGVGALAVARGAHHAVAGTRGAKLAADARLAAPPAVARVDERIDTAVAAAD
jgi:hypothetical protein